jgi:hypothetical protein
LFFGRSGEDEDKDDGADEEKDDEGEEGESKDGDGEDSEGPRELMKMSIKKMIENEGVTGESDVFEKEDDRK